MRRIQSFDDVQIVLNDLLNERAKERAHPLDRSGLRISNLGEGVAPDDAATVSQLPNIKVPTKALTEYHYTIVWSKEQTPELTDIIPPFCIVERGRVGNPVAVWLATGVLGESKLDDEGHEIGTLKINIIIDARLPVEKQRFLLVKDLELKIDKKGPAKSSNFIVPIHTYGLDSFIQPVIRQVNKQASISIGLVLKNQRSSNLA